MTWWQRLRDSFWFLPALMCLTAVVAAEALVVLDSEADLSFGPLDAVMYRVGAGGSRSLLEAIATSVLAAAATSFSITIAVISLASSTYGPRLVRNFMADRGNQVVLGAYLGTFLYCLLVLRTIRDDGSGGQVFVPHAAVAVAVVLALVSVGLLVYFVHHISDSVQVWTLAQRVRDDLLAVVDRTYPEVADDGPPQGPDLPPAGQGERVKATSDGYLARIDAPALVRLARDRDAVVVLQVRPGAYCVRGSTLARIHGVADDAGPDLAEAVRSHVLLKDERTPHQDVEFAVQQLIELAVRALSPSTNDPYTALNALDQLSAALVLVASRPVPSPQRRDADGTTRLLVPVADPEALVGLVYEALRTYALAHPVLLRRAVEVADRMGGQGCHPAIRRLLVDELDVLLTTYADTHPPERDLHRLRAELVPVRARLTRPGGDPGD